MSQSVSDGNLAIDLKSESSDIVEINSNEKKEIIVGDEPTAEDLVMADETPSDTGNDAAKPEAMETNEVKPVETEETKETSDEGVAVKTEEKKEEDSAEANKPEEPVKEIFPQVRLARIPREVFEYMARIEEDDSIRINVTQFRNWISSELYTISAMTDFDKWETKECDLLDLTVPKNATYDIYVRSFLTEKNEAEEKRIEEERQNRKRLPANFHKLSTKQRKRVLAELAEQDKKKLAAEKAEEAGDETKGETKADQILPAAPVPKEKKVQAKQPKGNNNNNNNNKANRKRPNNENVTTPNAKRGKANAQRGNQMTNKNNKNNNQGNRRMPMFNRGGPRGGNFGGNFGQRGNIWSNDVSPWSQGRNNENLEEMMRRAAYEQSQVHAVPPPVPRSQLELNSSMVTPSAMNSSFNSNMGRTTYDSFDRGNSPVRNNSNMGFNTNFSGGYKADNDLSRFVEPLDNSFSNGGNAYSANMNNMGGMMNNYGYGQNFNGPSVFSADTPGFHGGRNDPYSSFLTGNNNNFGGNRRGDNRPRGENRNRGNRGRGKPQRR